MNGLIERLLQLGANLLVTARGSVETWAEELHAEERRVMQTIVWFAATFLFGAATLLWLSVLALALLPAHLRLLGLAALAGLSLAVFLALAVGLRRRLAQPARLPVAGAVVFSAQVLALLVRLVRPQAPSDPSA